MKKPFLHRLQEKVVVFDGAMGTSVQGLDLSEDDFWGKEGCNELLVLSKPGAIRDIHSSFLDVGCDVIETDTFGGTSIVLGDYDLADKVYEINKAAAEIARSVADEYSTPDHPRYAAGSVGPGTKLPSLSHTSYAELYQAYYEQVHGLFDGGVDLFIVETVQDPLQAKAALNAVFQVMRQNGRRLPVMASVTMETTGTMLLGTDMLGALSILEAFEVDVVGLNCATGPTAMSEHVHTLSAHSPFPISVIPNAGLPRNVDGETVYDLKPHDMAHDLSHFISDLGVSIVGGCCGTTPEHLKAVVEQAASLNPAARRPRFEPAAASLYGTSTFQQEPRPLIIGERTNANGSKKFRELLLAEDLEAMVAMAREQADEGAHVLDVCLAYVGRDEAADMNALIPRLNSQVMLPLMIDSTELPAIKAALQNITGRAIVNSINLEDGPAKAEEVIALCREFGAGLVCLTIDEDGMAKTAGKKLEIAERIYDLAVTRGGLRESDLFFDPLTFTLASGDEEFRKSAIETLEGIKLIKKRFPAAMISLGISNVSFGLKLSVRHVLNSVFLHQAIEAGLDAAIMHAGRILPYHEIGDDERQLFEDLTLDRRRDDYDPLEVIVTKATAGTRGRKARQEIDADLPIEERLKQRIIKGNRVDLEQDLDIALKSHPALEIINSILLDGMQVVGELFGAGKLQLPFVLQSAETMKASVAHLEPHMEKSAASQKGKIILATVKGDVHDIGKNLVDIILSNNGYQVVNLGIKVPVESMIKRFEEEAADAIGMSGLLVKSTVIMKENLEVLNDHGISPPIVLGGAALNRRYVEQDLQSIYQGHVSYARDAFDGLDFMEALRSGIAEQKAEPVIKPKARKATPVTTDREKLEPAERIPVPPFFGRRVINDLNLDQIYPFINTAALFRGQWGFKRGKLAEEEFQKIEAETVKPLYQRLQSEMLDSDLLQPKVVYGYYPCHSEGERLWIYEHPDDERPSHHLDFPRQQKSPGRCISDFFLPLGSERKDLLGIQLVTVGHKASEYAKELYDANSYKDYLYFHGFAVETAEALAEFWHARVRKELGIDAADGATHRDLIHQKYQGSRYSFGYPACPDLQSQTVLFELLDAESEDITLTESFQIVPEQSTSALVVHHPKAKYFSV